MQKRLNPSICCFDYGLEWAKGCTSSVILARWRQCALMKGHVAVTCRMTLNHRSTAAIRLMANYFDHLSSLDTPTYTVAQIDKRIEPSTVLWTFHTQPSSCSLYCFVSFCTRQIFSACMFCAQILATPVQSNNLRYHSPMKYRKDAGKCVSLDPKKWQRAYSKLLGVTPILTVVF